MSKISIDLSWKIGEGIMTPGNYSNEHEIVFTPNTKIIGDTAPDWKGNKLNTNPEQALAAAKAQGKFDKKNPVEKSFNFLNN